MQATIKEKVKGSDISTIAKKLHRTATSTGKPVQAAHGPTLNFRRNYVHGICIHPEDDPAIVVRANDVRHIDTIEDGDGEDPAAVARRTANAEGRPTIVRRRRSLNHAPTTSAVGHPDKHPELHHYLTEIDDPATREIAREAGRNDEDVFFRLVFFGMIPVMITLFGFPNPFYFLLSYLPPAILTVMMFMRSPERHTPAAGSRLYRKDGEADPGLLHGPRGAGPMHDSLGGHLVGTFRRRGSDTRRAATTP